MQNMNDEIDALEKLMNEVMSNPINKGKDELLKELSAKIEDELESVNKSLKSVCSIIDDNKSLTEENKDLIENNYAELSDEILKVNSAIKEASTVAEQYHIKLDGEVATRFSNLVDKMQSENDRLINNVTTAIQSSNFELIAELSKATGELGLISASLVDISEAVKCQTSLIQNNYATLMENLNTIGSVIRDASANTINQAEKHQREIEEINNTIPNCVSTASANLADGLKAQHGVVLTQLQQVTIGIKWQILISAINFLGLVGIMLYLITR